MKVHPYLNFDGKAEEAFNFYKSIFGGEFSTIMKMTDAPGSDQLTEEEQNRIMHISLPITSQITLMASDIMPSAGQKLNLGNQTYIMLNPENKEEADRLFNGLSKGGNVEMPMEEQFWGDYFGSFTDKYGIMWMINCFGKQP